MEQSYVILGSNSNNQVQAYGTSTGKPFQSEQAAERMRTRMDRRFRSVDFLVLPITAIKVEELSPR